MSNYPIVGNQNPPLERPTNTPLIDRYLVGLNPPQREAVKTLEGPVLVLAGAGTGKTRVLTTRLAHLLASGAAKPWSVLAVTFTNKAAREMRERVSAIIGPMAEQVWLGTFHALCARLLRRHAELVGLQSNFTILDADDQVRLLKQILQAEKIDDKKWPARVLTGVIQRWKDRGLTPDKISYGDTGDLAAGHMREVYRQYQNRLLVLNAADFGDLLLHCLTLFKENPDVLELYQDRFSHILVDEYQDTNVAQYLWLRLLAQKKRNICCVGDDDQSIYGWRGAEVGNILKFESHFPGACVIRLEENYRSTSRVLAVASGLIAHNEGRLGKTLWTQGNEGEKIKLRGVWDGEEEARLLADEIESRQRKGIPLNEMAILVRAGFQTREFEERFLTLGIPYQVIGGARFYERMEVRDAIAYLRVIHQPDDDLALERIVNKPKRGIGAASLQAVHHLARADQISLWVAISRILETDELRPAARRTLAELVDDFYRWRGMLETEDHAELAGMVLDESGYTAMLQADKSPEAPGRLENLKELVSALEEFENLGGFLEHISLVMENVDAIDGDQVSLMTLHAAKGLEFDVVFLPGWEEGVFPSQRALDEGGLASLEEERRLAYVAITRARKACTIFHAANRRIYGQWTSSLPSRFIGELPEDHVESESTMSGGASLWRANWSERDDPFAHVTRDRPDRSNKRGPGWQRALATGYETKPARVQESRRSAASFAAKPRTDVALGARVFHDKFGYGTVMSQEGNKLEIEFETSGTKRVIDSFVKLAD